MYTNARFQSVRTTSDFGTRFVQKYMNDKTFEKANIKMVISILQCTPVQNFSQFEELQFFGPNMPKKI